MIEKLVHDCEQALAHNLYFAALNIALTLPDICGKVAYPSARTGERYKQWYEEQIGRYERFSANDEMPYASGEVVYSLRCSMLHEGTPNTNPQKCDITHFSLIVEKTKADAFGYACEMSSMSSDGRREIRLSVHTLCTKLCRTALKYYQENREKFAFNYELVDWDEQRKRMAWLCQRNAGR